MRRIALRDISPVHWIDLHVDRATRAQVAVWLLLACVVIQARLVHPGAPELSRILLLLCLCGLIAGTLVYSTAEPQTLEAAVASPAARTWWIDAAAAAIGIGCAVIGAALVASDEWNAQWWWLAGMAIPLAVLIGHRVLIRRSEGARFHLNRLELAGMTGLLLLALAIRLPHITDSPPFIFGDEASCGLYGRLFNTGHIPLLSISWYGLPMFSYAVSGVGLRLFGDNLVGLRDIDAIIGAFGVVLVYLLGKEWFGRRAGALAALVLAVSFLHVELSRDGLHYIQGPTGITLTLYLVTLWLKRGGPIIAFLSGISLIFDLQVYWSARLAWPLVGGILVFIVFTRREMILLHLRELAWCAAGAVVAGLPVAYLFRSVPGSFSGHQGSVSIFSSDPNTRGHIISQYGHIGTVQLVLEQSWRVLTTFNARTDASMLFGTWPGTLLDGITGAILPAAIALALFRWKRWEYAAVLAWFWGVTVAGIVTIDPPIWPRLFALAPAVALMVGVLLSDLWGLFARPGRQALLPAAAVAAALLAISVENLHSAFVDFPDTTRQTVMEATDVGNFLARAPGASHTVLLSDGSMFVDYEPVRFLAPQSGGCTLMQGQPLSACPIAAGSKLFVLLPGRAGDLGWLEKQRPGGRVVTVGVYNYGQAQILAYELG